MSKHATTNPIFHIFRKMATQNKSLTTKLRNLRARNKKVREFVIDLGYCPDCEECIDRKNMVRDCCKAARVRFLEILKEAGV